ncbi:putative Glyco_trans_4-like_N domain-containing protein [Vibrio chagasii]|nr:putative Glyco_trans_4-like_N domain-containing protein [Vibrio chagasii]
MKRILHLHEKFWPYKGGSTTRLLNLINGTESIHYVLSRTHDAGLKTVERLGKNIIVIRYNSDFELCNLVIKLAFNRWFDIFHIHNLRASLVFLPMQIFFCNRSILELHSIYIPSKSWKKAIANISINFYRRILLLSDKSKNLLFDNYPVTSKDITVIENGICLDSFKYKRNLSGNIRVVYVGSLKGFQGVDQFVSVANLVKRQDIVFDVFGGSCQEIKFLKGMDNNNKVNFHGEIDFHDVPQIYAESDILLMTRSSMPSTDSAIPIKPIEALSVGCTVVSTRVGGMDELKSKLNSPNLVLLESFDEIVSYIDNYKREFYYTKYNLSYFDRKIKSSDLESLYEEVLINA